MSTAKELQELPVTKPQVKLYQLVVWTFRINLLKKALTYLGQSSRLSEFNADLRMASYDGSIGQVEEFLRSWETSVFDHPDYVPTYSTLKSLPIDDIIKHFFEPVI